MPLGLGPSHFIGNKRFRDLVDSRKAEYNALNSYNEKAVIAWEVYNEVSEELAVGAEHFPVDSTITHFHSPSLNR